MVYFCFHTTNKYRTNQDFKAKSTFRPPGGRGGKGEEGYQYYHKTQKRSTLVVHGAGCKLLAQAVRHIQRKEGIGGLHQLESVACSLPTSFWEEEREE